MFWSIRRSRAQPQRTRKCPLLAPASSRKAGACRWHLRHTPILRTAGLCNLIRLRGIFRLENLYRGGREPRVGGMEETLRQSPFTLGRRGVCLEKEGALRAATRRGRIAQLVRARP